MSEISRGANGVNFSVQRADELFQQHRLNVFRHADLFLSQLLLVEWPSAVLIAVFAPPEVWFMPHHTLSIGIAAVAGGFLSIFPFCLARFSPSRPLTRHTIAIAQMLMS